MKRKILIYVLLLAALGVSIIAPLSCGAQVTELALPYPVKLINPKPIDFYYYNTSGAPYTNTAQVISQVTSAARYQGQTFNVNGAEYWFAAGIADINLVAKGGSSGVTNSAPNHHIASSDGTNLIDSQIDLNSGTFTYNSGSQLNFHGLFYFSPVAFPVTSSPTELHFANYQSGGTVNTVIPVATFSRLFASGTAGAGIGTSLVLETQTGASTYKIGSTIESTSTNIGAGSESFDLVFKTMGGSFLFEKLRITGGGRLYGTSLHNNPSTISGPTTTTQYIASGTYTPTSLGGGNLSSVTTRDFQWIRVGNVVTVSGNVDITTTASSSTTSLGLTLPVDTNLPSVSSAVGTATEPSSTHQSGVVVGCIGCSSVLVNFYSTSTSPTTWSIIFTYLVN